MRYLLAAAAVAALAPSPTHAHGNTHAFAPVSVFDREITEPIVWSCASQAGAETEEHERSLEAQRLPMSYTISVNKTETKVSRAEYAMDRFNWCLVSVRYQIESQFGPTLK